MSNTINVLDNEQQIQHRDVLSEPVYVQVPLEDGRVMMLPAHRLQQVQQVQQQQPIHVLHQGQQLHQVQQRTQQQQPQQQVQQINRLNSLGERIETGALQGGDLGSLVQSLTEQDFLFQPQSNIQYLRQESAKAIAPPVQECELKCGSNGSNKGPDRLVTDPRCGHTICLKCIMKQPNACPLCQKEHLLDRHSVVAKVPGSSVCKVCEKSFHRAGDLIRHERICHGINTGEFACSHCSKSFVRSFDLRRHLRTHNGDKQFSCNVCGKGFNRGENLRRHMNVHTGLRPFNCEYCDRTFTQHENLKRHNLTHTGEYQKYKCSTCKKEFTRLASLKRHEHRHTGLWPYTCADCNKGFSEPGLYQKHRLVHQGIKPYICTTCNKGFNNPKAARNHRRIHTGDRPYKCQLCDQQFSQWGNLKRHKQIHLKDAKTKLRPNSKRLAKRKKDPARPKLPMTAYFSWFMDSRSSLQESHPELKMTELARIAGQLWKELDSPTREYYEKKAGEEKEKYREALKVYNTDLKNSLEVQCKMVDVGSLTEEHGTKEVELASDKADDKEDKKVPGTSFTVESTNTITFKSSKTYQFSPHRSLISVGGNPSGTASSSGVQPSIKTNNRHTGTQSQGTQSNRVNQSSNHGNRGNHSSEQSSSHNSQPANHNSHPASHNNESSNHGNQAPPNKEFTSFDGLSAYIESDDPSQDKGSLLESASRSAGLHPEVLQGSIMREDSPSFNIFRRNNYNNNNYNNNYSYSNSTNSYNQYSFTANSELPSVAPLNENSQELASTLYDPSSLEQSFQSERRETDKGI